jgi:hypothetical protein
MRPCFISLKKLHPTEEARINRLLAQEEALKKKELSKKLGKKRHH